MAAIEKRIAKNGEETFRVKIRKKGYPVQTATFKRMTDAKKWVQQIESAIDEGRHFKTAEAKKHTFIDLVARYISDVLPDYSSKEQKERKSKLEWWAKSFGDYSLADITPSVIVERRNQLGRSAATTDKYLKNLSHAFNKAVNEWEWLEENPVKKVSSPKLPQGRVRFLEDDERERLLDSCRSSTSQDLYLAVVLSISTGMRKGELMRLSWRDINLKDQCIILHKTKNGERRRIPVKSHALELLIDRSKVRRLDTPLLFPGIANPAVPIDLRSAFNRACRAAQVGDFRWHDLRHCTASYLAMNGSTPSEIAELLGHKTLQMVKRYAHLSDSHNSQVLELMNDKLFENVKGIKS